MFNFFKKNKVGSKNNEKKSKFDINIPESSLLSVDCNSSPNMTIPPVKYRGKFLKKENNIITIEVCMKKNQPAQCGKNTTVTVSYDNQAVCPDVSKAKIFSFPAKILEIKSGEQNGDFSLAWENGESVQYSSYIFNIEATAMAAERPLRKFFRIDMSVPVCYKYVEDDKTDETADNKSDVEKGYVKLFTIDISAGGFKCRSARYIEPGTILECMILLGYEALPASVKILETALNTENRENPDDIYVYIVRAIFLEINDDVRDRIIMHIFNYQQKKQNFQHKLDRIIESYNRKTPANPS